MMTCTTCDESPCICGNCSRDECVRLRARVKVLEEALRPLLDVSLCASAGPVYVIGSRFGAPYNRIGVE